MPFPFVISTAPEVIEKLCFNAFNKSCFVSLSVIEKREYFPQSLMMGHSLSLDRGMPLCEIKYIDGQSRGVARYIIKLTHPSSASTNSLHPRAVVNVPTCTRHLNDLPTTLAPTSQTFANPTKSKRLAASQIELNNKILQSAGLPSSTNTPTSECNHHRR